MDRLRRLEHEWELFKTGPGPHDCLMEEVGVCPQCESYQAMPEEIWEELHDLKRLMRASLEQLQMVGRHTAASAAASAAASLHPTPQPSPRAPARRTQGQ